MDFIGEHFGELIEGYHILKKAYDLVKNIEHDFVFAAVISMLVDQWMADHDMTPETARELKKSMLMKSDEIYAEFGMMDKTGRDHNDK